MKVGPTVGNKVGFFVGLGEMVGENEGRKEIVGAGVVGIDVGTRVLGAFVGMLSVGAIVGNWALDNRKLSAKHIILVAFDIERRFVHLGNIFCLRTTTQSGPEYERRFISHARIDAGKRKGKTSLSISFNALLAAGSVCPLDYLAGVLSDVLVAVITLSSAKIGKFCSVPRRSLGVILSCGRHEYPRV